MTTEFCTVTSHKSWTIDEPFNRPSHTDFWSVLRLAQGVDHDEERIHDWYLTVKIHELGDMTAQELVQLGDADLVIGFLRSIRRGYRD